MYVIECPYLSLEKTFTSNQSMRTRMMAEGKYLVLDGNRYCKVIQQKERLVFDCSEDDFYQYWFNFFDMKRPYDLVHYNLQHYADSNLYPLINRAKGVRILRQDPFEVAVSSILCHGKSKYHGAQLVDQFVHAFGQVHTRSMAESGKVTWYSFPTPEQIYRNAGSLQYMDLTDQQREAIIAAARLESAGFFHRMQQSGLEDIYAAIQDLLCDGKLGMDVGLSLLLYSYGNIDVLPASDEIVKSYLANTYGAKDLVTVSEKHFPQVQDTIGLLYQYILWNQYNPVVELSFDWERR